MLDINKIRLNPDEVKAGLKAKEVDCDAIVDRIVELDVQVRGLKTATETKTAQKNKIAKENGKLFGMVCSSFISATSSGRPAEPAGLPDHRIPARSGPCACR